MKLALQDRKLIQVTLDFANLSEIKTTEQVANMFFPVVRAFSGDPQRVIKLLRPDEVNVFEANQAELISWLERIVRFKSLSAKEKAELENQVAVRLGNVETKGIISFKEGRLRRNLQYRLSGVEACYGFATALLLDEANELMHRVGKCGLDECGRYFVDFPKGRARPRTHCSKKHANAHRQRRYRQRKRSA